MIDSFSGVNRFLSNFFLCEIEWDGRVWASTEHALQAAKTIDREEQEHIRGLNTPGKAKRAGRKVTLRRDWDTYRNQVMAELVFAKFKQHPELKQQLLDTYPQELVEANSWGDVYWGVCRGKGKNNLGKLLMAARAVFFHATEKKS